MTGRGGRRAGAVLLAMVLSACGGGDGGSALESTARVLGSRELPGHTVRVEAVTALTPGSTATIAVDIQPPVPFVRLRSGAHYASAALYAAGTKVGDVWHFQVSIPAPLPADWGVFLRLKDASGNVLETGSHDFRISP